MEIRSFRGEYDFLSNFYEAPVTYEGITYPHSEAAFQAAKVLDEEMRRTFTALTPTQAKHRGKRVALRSDWNEVRLNVMEEVVRCKFTQHPELAQRLLDTGDALLMEGNRWRDTFWGVSTATGKGQNHLGKILMKIREELRA